MRTGHCKESPNTDAWKSVSETLCGGQFTSSTWLIKLIWIVIPPDNAAPQVFFNKLTPFEHVKVGFKYFGNVLTFSSQEKFYAVANFISNSVDKPI